MTSSELDKLLHPRDVSFHDKECMEAGGGASEAPPTERSGSSQPQGASKKMKPFLPLFNFIQSTYISVNYDDHVNDKCTCGSDCYQSPPSCSECLKHDHRYLPFHQIEKWNRHYFVKSSLWNLGFKLSFGHGGDPYPNQLAQGHHKMIVLDINGYHNIDVQFCYCHDQELDEAKQLFAHQLFPATTACPETVFTIAVLDSFNIHHSTSTKSADSFCAALRKMSSVELPDKISDAYHTFIGQAHSIDKFITHQHQKYIALFCPACPETDWNIELEVLEHTLESDKKLMTHMKRPLMLVVVMLLKNMNIRDIFLRWKKTLQRQKCNCMKLCTLKFDHLLKFMNLAVTRVVRFLCIRHIMFRPDAVVDMYVRERLYYVDCGDMLLAHLHM
ncbi:hypothetical protein IW262DRAFT_1297995 [Armillaria fumosa]|nr:hypothetical protein IW262DRAFT_1297995 [Armillaria fumosa]